MKKTFISVSFYTADEKLCEYEKNFGEKSKNRDKSIQPGTPGQHTKIRDCPGKTGVDWIIAICIRIVMTLKKMQVDQVEATVIQMQMSVMRKKKFLPIMPR